MARAHQQQVGGLEPRAQLVVGREAVEADAAVQPQGRSEALHGPVQGVEADHVQMEGHAARLQHRQGQQQGLLVLDPVEVGHAEQAQGLRRIAPPRRGHRPAVEGHAEGDAQRPHPERGRQARHPVALHHHLRRPGQGQAGQQPPAQRQPSAIADVRQRGQVPARQGQHRRRADRACEGGRDHPRPGGPEAVDDVEAPAPMLGGQGGQGPQPPRPPAHIVHLGAQQRPLAGPRLLLQGEDVQFVAAVRQPFDQPQQAGDHPLLAGAVDAAGHDEGDLHRRASSRAV